MTGPHCGNPRCRAPHDVITPTNPDGWTCPGNPQPRGTTLAELLARRPDLADLTATTHARALEVSCA